MSWLDTALQALGITGRNVFRPRTTERLPWLADRPKPERYRTSFALVHDEHGDPACIACKLCERICPSTVITVEDAGRWASEKSGKARNWEKDFTLDLNACIHCELCVQVCPVDAIVMLRVQDTPGYSREDLFLTREKLYAHEALARAHCDGTVLQEMQDPKRGLHRPDKTAAPAAPRPAAPPAAAEPKPAEGAPAPSPAPAASTAPAMATAPDPGAAATAPAAGGAGPTPAEIARAERRAKREREKADAAAAEPVAPNDAPVPSGPEGGG